jgi:LysR family transcriptional regulator, hydrogen peroxide-inducible genes activator
MLWRKSSAMSGFLKQLADVFRALPRDLLDPHTAATASAKRRRVA